MEEHVTVSSDLECAASLSISKAPWAILPVMASFQVKNSPLRVQFTPRLGVMSLALLRKLLATQLKVAELQSS